MSPSPRQTFRPSAAKTLVLVILCLAFSSPVFAAKSNSAADFLFQIAMEYRREGQLEEAMHELQKVLLIEPAHEDAIRELDELKTIVHDARSQAMQSALSGHQAELDRLVAEGAMDRETADGKHRQFATNLGFPPPPAPKKTVVPAKVVRHRRVSPAQLASSVRVPDPRVNGVRWFYIFGQQGEESYGALVETQGMYVEVPREAGADIEIRVLDADTRGRWDEMDGGWNTGTTYRVYAGGRLLETKTVGANEPDGTVLALGPFKSGDGEPHGDRAVFKIEVEGEDGDDNNLFAFEISPGDAQVFSYNPSIRLAEPAGSRMRFFPYVPEGSSQVIESNYDFDDDGGRAAVISRTADGRARDSRWVNASGEEEWATTDVAVAPGTDGARWTYQIMKGTQREANMAFRLTNESGERLPVYATRGGTSGQPMVMLASATRPAPDAWRPDPSPRTSLPDAPRPASLNAPAPKACNTFKFDASGTHDPDNDLLTYTWEFGDGTTGDGIEVWHTYDRPGRFTAKLTVTDTSSKESCAISTVMQTVTVNTPPTAVLDGAELSCAGAQAAFSAAKSSDAGGALTYHWDFGDGTTGDGMTASHAYAEGGAYSVQLVVDDGQGTSCSTDVAMMTVRVNTPPVADAGEAAQMCALLPDEPLDVSLSAYGSTDPDGDPLTYRWDFGDGSGGEGERTEHTYSRGGKYTARLTVDDGTGSACSTATATVPVQVNHAPQAAISAGPEPAAEASPALAGCAKEPVKFNAAASTDPDGDVLTYRWDFGDGGTGEGVSPSHIYDTHGLYSTQLIVDDGSGMSCSEAIALAIADVNAPPTAKMLIQDEQGREVGAAQAAAAPADSSHQHVPAAPPYTEGPLAPPPAAPGTTPGIEAGTWWPESPAGSGAAETAVPVTETPDAPVESAPEPLTESQLDETQVPAPTYSEPAQTPDPVVTPPEDLTFSPPPPADADEGTDFLP